MKKGNRACALGNGEWGMKNEGIEHGKREWGMENGEQNGEGRMENEECGMGNGDWRILKIRNLSKRESLKRGIFKKGNL